MTELAGLDVQHRAFGDGVILRADEKYVTVRFADKEKTFVYPDAFNGFMTLKDKDAASAVAEDVAAAVAKKEKHERERAEQREIQMRTGIVIAGSRPVTDRPTDYTPVPDETAEEI